MYVELRTPGFLRAETPVLRPIVSRNVPDAIHNYTIRTNPPALVGQDRQRGDAHIVGYYAPATGGRAKSRSPAQGGCGSSDPMREAGVPSTGEWVVPAPPGVVMVAPLDLPRNAEGAR